MSTALYRRYRPETFDEVIGQDHVTEPLKAALRSNRVTHAYLFSGPRGCGKTTSARILARCLNCAQGPTDTPCGTCESCKELATGGPGSLDVVEIDAASHNSVDDARDLRERATFAPVRDRYKVFILDEAHMVTPQGFNALLKLVEEPPEHVKFVFATTEPERVIGTIRSRTHHYPFRLVPSDVLIPFLGQLCDQESVEVGEGVLPLVVRAGGGSVRDSLSVLDQLMAGSVDAAVSYERAIALLGYTDTKLLDETVEALANRDGAAIFATVDHMIETGQDPRRFVEDFLQRLRDLLIIAVAEEDARDILAEVPGEQRKRMFAQASQLGAPALLAIADLTDEALRSMVGATSPRLQLELLVGRMLVQLSSSAGGRRVVDDGAGFQSAGLDRGLTGSGSGSGAVSGSGDRRVLAGSDVMRTEHDAAALGPDGKPLTGAALAREQLRIAREREQATHTSAEAVQHGETTAQALRDKDDRRGSAGAWQSGSGQPAESAPQPAPEGMRRDTPSQSDQADDRRQHSPEVARSGAQRRGEDAERSGENAPVSRQPSTPDQRERSPEVKPVSQAQSAAAGAPTKSLSADTTGMTANLHGKWDEFIAALHTIMPSSAFLLREHGELVSEDAQTVTFRMKNPQLVQVFLNRHVGPVSEAIRMVTGAQKTPRAVSGSDSLEQGQPAPSNAPIGTPSNAPSNAPIRTSPNADSSRNDGAPSNVPLRENTGASTNTPTSANADSQWHARESESKDEGEAENHTSQVAADPDAPQYAPNPARNEVESAFSVNASQTTRQPDAEDNTGVLETAEASTQEQSIQAHEELAQNVEPNRTSDKPSLHVKGSNDTHVGGEQNRAPLGADDAQHDSRWDDVITGGARMDDLNAENSNMMGVPLVQKMFNAQVIDNDEGNN